MLPSLKTVFLQIKIKRQGPIVKLFEISLVYAF